MGKQTEIKDKYWVDFLKWYKDCDHKLMDYSVDGNSFHNTHVLTPVEDLFWYWLVNIKAEKNDADNFMAEL